MAHLVVTVDLARSHHVVGQPPLLDPTVADRQIKDLAEHVAGLLSPHATRNYDERNRPPYQSEQDPTRYQLDIGNDWHMSAERRGDELTVEIRHRYEAVGESWVKTKALYAMLDAFTGYKVQLVEPRRPVAEPAPAGRGT